MNNFIYLLNKKNNFSFVLSDIDYMCYSILRPFYREEGEINRGCVD